MPHPSARRACTMPQSQPALCFTTFGLRHETDLAASAGAQLAPTSLLHSERSPDSHIKAPWRHLPQPCSPPNPRMQASAQICSQSRTLTHLQHMSGHLAGTKLPRHPRQCPPWRHERLELPAAAAGRVWPPICAACIAERNKGQRSDSAEPPERSWGNSVELLRSQEVLAHSGVASKHSQEVWGIVRFLAQKP